VEQTDKSNHQDTPTGYLFLDLETGGLDCELHSILQVAAILTDVNLIVRASFMSYVRPHAKLKITKEALEINQLSLAELASAPDELTVARALHQFAHLGARPARFAGYNCKFDLPFLAGMWKRHDSGQPPYTVPWLDVLDIARTKLELNPQMLDFKLISVAQRLGVDPSGAHDASTDLMMTIEIARRLRKMPDKAGITLLDTARFSY
jgi:DNA polymerase III alpha subunit (gram-positive type)